MIKAVVSNGFIKNRISAASKKVQEKRTAALFNATAPSFVHSHFLFLGIESPLSNIEYWFDFVKSYLQ